ncbi:MAG: AAA family ATPase [Anaerolineae bacterium]|jgi:tetratricopeptide (TPR) repeat protein
MTEQAFVGRERELARLNEWLAGALAGQGQICFVTGEAGSGKTALIAEFARRAESAHPELLIAAGNCNAQTGIGDPYLPFREVLAQLTGDVEAKLAEGAITEGVARRLRHFLRISGQTLVELGPDLIGIFIPGIGLAAQAATFAAGKVGWLDELEDLEGRRPEPGAGPGLDQGRIFEQFTRVLGALAAQRPLVLVIDDLQWADASSVSLLFHLGRRLGESRILIVGAYRPEDVALGRLAPTPGSGHVQPHPLQDLITEFRRYFGDICIDLGRAQEAEGRRFLDALLDSQPNRLGEDFRRALFRHTGGQALFTVELLRDMRERGDLLPSAEGYWVERPTVAWDALPTRVEGVIEKRVGRLQEPLREALSVASVEGVEFTAQVVARVQEIKERRLLRDLSRELEGRHRLVRELGELEIDGQRFSRYRFAHALFQQYLYDDLGTGERRLLHGEIGDTLEALYSDRADEIAVHLAHHFTQGKRWEKAFRYLAAAGDGARRAYASHEAIASYTRAIEVSARITPPLDLARLLPVYEGRGLVWMLLSKYDEAIGDFEKARQLASVSEDLRQEGRSLLRLATANFMKFSQHHFRAEKAAREARRLSKQVGDQSTFSKSLAVLGFVYQARGDLQAADRACEESLEISRREGYKDALAPGLMMLGYQAYWQGDFERAIQLGQEGVAAARDVRDGLNELFHLTLLAQSYVRLGSYDQAHSLLRETLATAEERDNKHFIGRLTNTLGWFHLQLGDVSRAVELDRESVELGRTHRVSNVETSALINLGLDYIMLGDPERARSYLEPTFERVRQEASGAHQWRWQIRLLGGLAELHHAAGSYEDALRCVEEGIREAQATSSQNYVAEGWALRGRILAHLGKSQAAGADLQRAHALAQQLNSPSLSFPIAYYLGRWFETGGQPARAVELYAAAQATVEQIAGAVENQALRSTFLGLAKVRALREALTRIH